MSLRLQINLLVSTLTLIFSAALLYLQIDGLRAAVHEEVSAANLVTAQLLNRTVWGYAAGGRQAMQEFLRGVGRVRSNDIELYDGEDVLLYRSPPSLYKVGRSAPAWFEAMLSPPASVQTISLPDGHLVLRANASRAALDAWDDFTALAASALATLLALNALVFWIVGRAVRPFGQIVQALNQMEQGRFDITLPALPGTEAAAIGGAFNRMQGVLQRNIEVQRRAAVAERELSGTREWGRWLEQHVERERQMIARELHDEFGQSVTAIRSMALSVAQRVGSVDAESAQAAHLIAEESSRLYDAMHGLIPRLTPLVLDSLGLEAALSDLAERTRRNHPGLELTLQVQLGQSALGDEAALTLYRAAQEGMSNALRHGQAHRLTLQIQAHEDRVTLSLVDDGRGLPPEGSHKPGHYGLRWLEERVKALHGAFQIGAAAGGGVHLQLQLPLGMHPLESTL